MDDSRSIRMDDCMTHTHTHASTYHALCNRAILYYNSVDTTVKATESVRERHTVCDGVMGGGRVGRVGRGVLS